MKIANPIYDVVFKFLMEDPLSAKIFLSEITGLDIVSLDYLPQELVGKKHKSARKSVPQGVDLSVFRLDFSARIRDADGREKIILIELQKSNVNSQIMRFRRYVGMQYTNEQLFRWVTPRVGRRYKKGVPILSIYILGGAMAEFSDVPVLDINCQIVDRYAGKVLAASNHFIESLFHNGIIINISALYNKRRDELEKLLSIFDYQDTPKNKHIMNVKQTDFPDRFQPILRRLEAAIKEAEVEYNMSREDDVLADLYEQQRAMELTKRNQEEASRNMEKGQLMIKNGQLMIEKGQLMIEEAKRTIEEAKRIKEETKRIKEETKRIKEETKRMEEETKRMEEETKRMEEETKRMEEDAKRMKEEAVRDQEKAIRLLLEVGLSAEQISNKLGLPLEKILALRKS